MEKNEKFSVLWLPAWYPSELDAFNGDFVQRHARAAALYCKVHVICMIPDSRGKITKSVKVTERVDGNLTETIIYYYPQELWVSIVRKLFSGLKYMKIYRKAVIKHIQQHGRPHCVHVHVADKNGLVALWIKKTWKIPYLVSEHWTIFLREAAPDWNNKPDWFKRIWKRIITRSDGISAVSDHLGKSMVIKGAPNAFRVIPNVVDHKIFFPEETGKAAVPLFLHISMLNHQKNFKDILEAFSIVKKSGHAFRLSVFGPVNRRVHDYTGFFDLNSEVQFHGEVPQPVLADHLRKAVALVHYSRFETFGCVIIESHACGIPVIASNLPVHHETIIESENGVFAHGEDPQALAEKIIEFLQEEKKFSKKDMYEATKERYSYEVVGRSFYEWYQSLTSKIR